MMDIKGDFSGIAKEGIEKFITERHAKINIPYKVSKFPVELLTLSEQGWITRLQFQNLALFYFKNLRLK
jgi:hypothetical protein